MIFMQLFICQVTHFVIFLHQQWLIGYELTDTISVFTESAVHFLSSKKKIELLKQLENHKEENVPTIKLIVRDRVSRISCCVQCRNYKIKIQNVRLCSDW